MRGDDCILRVVYCNNMTREFGDVQDKENKCMCRRREGKAVAAEIEEDAGNGG